MFADHSLIFDNLPVLLSPDKAASTISCSRKTIYDMNYRPQKYKVPAGMFIKNGKKLLIRTDKLKDWFISRIGENQ